MKKSAFSFLIICAVIWTIFVDLNAQDIMLQGWYWDYPGTTEGALWADTLNQRAADLSAAGFTYVWLPPLSRASFGSSSNGYDPQDLFDLGEAYGGGATRFGAKSDLDDLISTFNSHNIKAVADVVYNHRDGGHAENNSAVEGWIENYNWTKAESGDNAYPSDRFRCILPLGGATGRGTGVYYFKIRSMSQHSKFENKPYKVYTWTNTVGWQGLPDQSETSANGGGDCGESSDAISLGRNMLATTDNDGCKTDEFALTISAGDFDVAGDTLYISISNSDGNYSDHYVYGIWYTGTSSDVQSALICQTFTDFTDMPSERGGMNYLNFKPNGNATQLAGDWDWPWFFYDYDQFVQSTQDTLFAWTRWLWSDVGIRGLRMDAVKHFTHEFVGDLFDDMHDNAMNPGMVVGEFYDGNAGALKGWLDNVKANMDADTKAAIQPRVFDFSLRQALKDACDSFGYDARNVFNSGLVDAAGASGFDAVTFTDNHDFRDAGQYIENDPILAYAYILANNQVGLPCVFYKDYINRGLRTGIDSLMQVHRTHIYGATGRDYLSRFSTPYSQSFVSGFASTTLFFQIMGTPSGRDLLVAVNFAGDTLKVTHGVNMVAIAEGDVFLDLLGRSTESAMTVNSSEVYFILPPRSYSVWARSVLLKTKIYLQGAFDETSGEMSTALNGGGVIPLSSPFSQDPRSVAAIPADIVDWIYLELRATPDGEAVAVRSAFLKKDGKVVDLDGASEQVAFDAAPGNYYVYLRHRNHLAALSAATVSLSSNSAMLYDFTADKNSYYGADAALVDSSPLDVWGMYAGDANGNGQVQNDDKNDFWKIQTGNAGYLSADFNVNGQVQNDDKNDLWKINVGKGSQAP